ncbi:MAG TPA: DUF3306 domain-containing protein [Steroidobacteraceae bacterium]|nr:DUF3306 domain-containing protein [Steroidobacteraceae bacterium]
MSERDGPRNAGDDEGHESFLSRWSRRKTEARREPAPAVEPTPAAVPASREPLPAAVPASSAMAAQVAAAAPASEPPPVVPLPDLATLGEDSDYSAFLSPGVDASLRRLALRKLFSSPKFNVFDGLDTYRDDYTSFPALGDVVTADMRHQIERLAAKAAELTEPAAPGQQPTAAAAQVAVAAETDASSTDVDPTIAGNAAHQQTPPADADAASPADSTPADASAASHEYEHDRSSTS